eukprot:5943465-Amphidinium_carterae.1
MSAPFEVGEQVIEWVFLVIYTVELTMKLCVHGCYLFVGSDWAYNVLDFTLVITALLSQLLDTLNPSFLRALRILKMGKALKLCIARFPLNRPPEN